MHWPPDDGTPLEDVLAALLDLVAEGKVGAAALSNHDVGQLERAEALGHVSAVQPPFSPINRSAAADVLPWCAGHDTGAIVYSPMQSGLLSGAFSAERAAALGTGDWRSRNAEFSGERLTANLALAEVLGGIGERHGTGAGSVAIAWTLAFAGVSGAIVGARSPAQVDGWLTASSLELSTEELDEIARAIERTGAGSGPTRPSTASQPASIARRSEATKSAAPLAPSPSSSRRISAEPTTTPSATAQTSAACSGFETPTPTSTGVSVTALKRRAITSAEAPSVARSPVTPSSPTA